MNQRNEAHPAPDRLGVVIACRRADGRWLMVRRGANVERAPLKVGFPGGEIEPGETQQEAVIREAREEVGIEVRPVRCVWEYNWSIPGAPRWALFGWVCEWQEGPILANAAEIAEVLWLTAEQGANHPDALPTMAALCEALEEFSTAAKGSDRTV